MHYSSGELAAGTCGTIEVRKKINGRWIGEGENQWPPMAQDLMHVSSFYAGYNIGNVSISSVTQNLEKLKFCVPGYQ